MRELLNTIELTKNSRGCWDIDTTKGCANGMAQTPKGCYGECYAFRALTRRGYDFSKTVVREFESREHIHNIVSHINKIDMPFVRIGVIGDPSENWEHTLSVCEKIAYSDRPIVIITKHWKNLSDAQLIRLSKLNVCVNTSISALDQPGLISNRLDQYNKLKNYCASVLRIVSCDFNTQYAPGKTLDNIQDWLFDNENILDTVFRVSKESRYVKDDIINIENIKFLGQSCWASIKNKDTYFGECSNCPDMCGIQNIKFMNRKTLFS